MNPLTLIDKFYPEENELKHILLVHSRLVTDKALALAKKHPELDLDLNFIEEAAMLHDIGIFLTDAPDIQCFGTHPYICHGYLGADLVRKEGFGIQEPGFRCRISKNRTCLFRIGICFRSVWKKRLFALPISFSRKPNWIKKRVLRRHGRV